MPQLKAFLSAPTPYVTRPVVLHLVEYPPFIQEPEDVKEARRLLERQRVETRRKLLRAKANVLYLPMDNGEYLYYHRPTGRFTTLDWHVINYNELVLSIDDMRVAKRAFALRFPDQRWFLGHYDVSTNKLEHWE